LDGVTELLDTISVEELTAVSDQSVKRVRWDIENEGISDQIWSQQK
jgi:hypothetical protein